jgi:hypothetical protein
MRYRLADGSEKVGRTWTIQSFSIGDLVMYPMRADGVSGSGWRYLWRVDAIEEPDEPGVRAVVVFEFERPDSCAAEPWT